MYPVQVGNGPCGASIPKGWTIVEVNGNLFYVKEKAAEYSLQYLRQR